MKNKINIITRTATFLALLLVLQYVTKFTNLQLLTGSVVNLLLGLSTYFCGLYGGLTIAVVSPFLAFLFGITPLASILLVPCIIIGNAIYVVLFGFLFKKNKIDNKCIYYLVSGLFLILGSFAKMGILYASIKSIAIPSIISGKPVVQQEKIIATLTASFTWPQLFSALIGGVFCIVLVQIFKKILKNTI